MRRLLQLAAASRPAGEVEEPGVKRNPQREARTASSCKAGVWAPETRRLPSGLRAIGSFRLTGQILRMGTWIDGNL